MIEMKYPIRNNISFIISHLPTPLISHPRTKDKEQWKVTHWNVLMH